MRVKERVRNFFIVFIFILGLFTTALPALTQVNGESIQGGQQSINALSEVDKSKKVTGTCTGACLITEQNCIVCKSGQPRKEQVNIAINACKGLATRQRAKCLYDKLKGTCQGLDKGKLGKCYAKCAFLTCKGKNNFEKINQSSSQSELGSKNEEEGSICTE